METPPVFIGCNRHISERELVRPTHFNKVDGAAGRATRKGPLTCSCYWTFRQIGGHADNRELRRVCVYETRQPKRGGLEAVALHIVAFNPLHSA